MAVRSHVCMVAVGESVDVQMRLNIPVLTSATTLYSGRLFQIDSNGRASEGVTTPANPVYIAHRGVECADVRGAKAILSTQTGSLPADASGNAMISGIPLRAGLVILTTEYQNTGSYSQNDAITGATGSGRFKASGGDANDETLGFILGEGSSPSLGVNAAWASSRKLMKIQFTRSGYGL